MFHFLKPLWSIPSIVCLKFKAAQIYPPRGADRNGTHRLEIDGIRETNRVEGVAAPENVRSSEPRQLARQRSESGQALRARP